MKRREFMVRGGRMALLAALGTGSGYLVYNGLKGGADPCRTNPYCRICSTRRSCTILNAKKDRDGE